MALKPRDIQFIRSLPGLSGGGGGGSPGQDGTDGADGKTILNGSGTPSDLLGVDGDFYINTANHNMYGPKTGGAWGSPTSLVGPPGEVPAEIDCGRASNP
jgi:integrin beta 8